GRRPGRHGPVPLVCARPHVVCPPGPSAGAASSLAISAGPPGRILGVFGLDRAKWGPGGGVWLNPPPPPHPPPPPAPPPPPPDPPGPRHQPSGSASPGGTAHGQRGPGSPRPGPPHKECSE